MSARPGYHSWYVVGVEARHESFQRIPAALDRFQPENVLECLLDNAFPEIGGRDRAFDIAAGGQPLFNGAKLAGFRAISVEIRPT